MRENGFRAIGGLTQRLTSGIAKGRGASIARLRADWSAIVGPDLAAATWPDALTSGRGRAGKVLRLSVSGAAALEVQHKAGQVVERVNGYYGHRMVDTVRVVQGMVPRRRGLAEERAPAPTPDQVADMAERAKSVEDPELRAALARLGARINRRHLLVGGLGATLLSGPEARAQGQDRARDKLLEALPDDHILGDRNAPNTLIDYASFTCPHCANFYIAVMPTLRQEWIDPGKLRLIHRHFPSDLVATRTAQLTECAPPDRFFATVELLFRRQVDWLSVGDPLVEVVTVLAGEGITQGKAAACFANDKALDKVVADVQSGQTLGVRFTPTLFINEEFYGNPGGADAVAAILRQVGR
ncbi:MAG: DciA family protein [Reyranella sp.]|uniref:DciA family protein n=1 Tax=Reyranella sp. TaxID=1929291 RepID=UPI003D13EFF1